MRGTRRRGSTRSATAPPYDPRAGRQGRHDRPYRRSTRAWHAAATTAPEPADGVDAIRLRRYETRTDRPLLVLALCFVAVYTVDVTVPDLRPPLDVLVEVASWLIWAVFAADLAARVWLAERRWRYLLTHPIDVLVVLLPALRPLRVLRVFSAGQALVTRGSRLALLRSSQAVAVAAGLLVLIAALAVLEAERDAPGSHMTTLADSLWWAATTVTTVGYGDTFPVTGTGRLVAVALMLVGISLVGLVTATVAAWFVAQTRDAAEAEDAALAARLARLEATLDEIHAALLGTGHLPQPRGDTTATGR